MEDSERIQIGTCTLILQNGDITKIKADFIVNAANKSLLSGGGIDGAIHRAGGEEIIQACRKFPVAKSGYRSYTADAKMTPSGNLPAVVVIHAVGPCVSPSYPDAITIKDAIPLLSQTYKTVLANADAYLKALKQNKKPGPTVWPEGAHNPKDQELLKKLQNGKPITIAIPTISTGLFGFPKKEAAHIALTQVLEYLQTQDTKLCEIYFIFYKDMSGQVAEDRKFYEEFLRTSERNAKGGT